MNDLMRNGLVWLVGAAMFAVLGFVMDAQVSAGLRVVAVWLFLVASVQIVRGLLQDQPDH